MFIGFRLTGDMGIECPKCRKTMKDLLDPGSTVIVIECRNPECEIRTCPMLVDRATMQVVQTIGWAMVDGEPAWPSHFMGRVDKENR